MNSEDKNIDEIIEEFCSLLNVTVMALTPAQQLDVYMNAISALINTAQEQTKSSRPLVSLGETEHSNVVNMTYGNHGWFYLNKPMPFVPNEFEANEFDDDGPVYLWVTEGSHKRGEGIISHSVYLSRWCPDDKDDAAKHGELIPIPLASLIMGAVSSTLDRHQNHTGGLTFESTAEVDKYNHAVAQLAKTYDDIADTIRALAVDKNKLDSQPKLEGFTHD